MNDPLTTNWFEGWHPPEHIPFEPHQRRVPSVLPDVNKLFAVQKSLVKSVRVLHAAESLERHDLAEVREYVDSAYRTIVGYLRTYSAGPEGGTF